MCFIESGRPPASRRTAPIHACERSTVVRPSPHLLFVAALTAALAGALSSAGCAQLSWQRADTDGATADADRTECRTLAHHQARRLTETPLMLPYFIGARDNRGRERAIPVVPWQQVGPPVWWPYAPSLAIDQITLNHELFEACMQAKGYRRLPVEEQPVEEQPAEEKQADEKQADEKQAPADEPAGGGVLPPAAPPS